MPSGAPSGGFSSFNARGGEDSSLLRTLNSSRSCYSLLAPLSPLAADDGAADSTNAANPVPLPDWCVAYCLRCQTKDPLATLVLMPGDNTVVFQACPVLPGIYVMESLEAVSATTTGAMEHTLSFGTLPSSKPYTVWSPCTVLLFSKVNDIFFRYFDPTKRIFGQS